MISSLITSKFPWQQILLVCLQMSKKNNCITPEEATNMASYAPTKAKITKGLFNVKVENRYKKSNT